MCALHSICDSLYFFPLVKWLGQQYSQSLVHINSLVHIRLVQQRPRSYSTKQPVPESNFALSILYDIRMISPQLL